MVLKFPEKFYKYVSVEKSYSTLINKIKLYNQILQPDTGAGNNTETLWLEFLLSCKKPNWNKLLITYTALLYFTWKFLKSKVFMKACKQESY